MGNSTNIGIYIGEGDKDIAAWFNLLQRHHLSRSKWVCGLLAAYSMGKPLQIGIVDRKAPLIREGPKAGDTVERTGHFKYGWHVRGPNKEFVIGSVVSVTIRNSEVQDILDEAWANGHKLATFIKALIRQNLKTGEKDIPPKADVLRRLWSEYLVSVNGTMTKAKRSNSLPVKEQKEEPQEDWTKGVQPAAPEPADREEPQAPPKQEPLPRLDNPDRVFQFEEDPPKEGPNTTHKLGKNPLLSQI